MEILRGLLVVLEGLISLLLIGVVLLQKSREQGLGMAFGANVGETLFGSRAGNVLTRATIWLGSAFVINTVILAMLFAGRERGLMEDAEDARGDEPAVEAPVSAEPVPPAAPLDLPAVEIPAPPPAAPLDLPAVEIPAAPPVPPPAAPRPEPIPAPDPAPEKPAPAP